MKIGKTTLAVQFPRNLLFAVEHGYNIINNIYAVDIPTWAEFKKYVKQLEEKDVKEMFDTVSIDTVSLLYERCEAYICDREGVDKIGDIPYGAGFKLVDQEFEKTLRKITQMTDENGVLSYGICFIGHEKVRVETDGQMTVRHIMPDMNDRCAKIINRMVDVTAYIGMEDGKRWIYPREITVDQGTQKTNIYAGSHFATLDKKIELSYQALVDAIADAMEVDGTGKKVVLDEAPIKVKQDNDLDFKQIRALIANIARGFMAKDESEGTNYMDEYRKIVEQHLGRNRMVKDCDETQVEMLSLILEDLKDLAAF